MPLQETTAPHPKKPPHIAIIPTPKPTTHESRSAGGKIMSIIKKTMSIVGKIKSIVGKIKPIARINTSNLRTLKTVAPSTTTREKALSTGKTV